MKFRIPGKYVEKGHPARRTNALLLALARRIPALRTCAALVLAASFAHGQQTPAPTVGPDPAKVPLVNELFQLTKPEQLLQQLLAQYKAAFANAAQNGFNAEVRKMGDDPAKYQGDFQKLENQVFGVLNSRLDWSKIKPQFVKAYSDTFTKDELSGIVAFYKTPAGKAEVSKMPGLMAKCSAIGQQEMASAGPQLQKIMVDFMNGIKQKSQASHPAPSPSHPK